MQNPIGCCLLAGIFIFLPFIPGVMSAFAHGGWMWGVGSIIYTIFTFWICAIIKDDKIRVGVYFLLMIPFYVLELYALSSSN